MDTNKNYSVEVAYDLYITDDNGEQVLVEKTSNEHPFKFISGMGMCLEAFEENILKAAGDGDFNFDVPTPLAYGEYVKEHVLELQKEIFNVNGKFDAAKIYPGSVIPMTNEDGNHFQGLVKEVRDDVVVMDFNHPLAGKDLTFKGKVMSCHEASNEEVQNMINEGEGHHCHNCNGDCGHEKGGCGHDDCNCGHEKGGDAHGDCGCGHDDCGCGHHHKD